MPKRRALEERDLVMLQRFAGTRTSLTRIERSFNLRQKVEISEPLPNEDMTLQNISVYIDGELICSIKRYP